MGKPHCKVIHDTGLSSLPDIWAEGIIFGFSGFDGVTDAGSGFVATVGDRRWSLLFHTSQKRKLLVEAHTEGEVVAATNDLLAADFGTCGELVMVWTAWHTLGGVLPDKAEASCGFLGRGFEAACEDSPIILPDGEAGGCTALMVRGSRFSFSYGTSEAGAVERAKKGLEGDLKSEIAGKTAFFLNLPTLSDPGRDRLLKKCASVMKVNTLDDGSGRWSTPDRVPHQNMWLWDSAFHSFGMNKIDAGVSFDFLRAMLESSWDSAEDPGREGMISHEVRVDGSRSDITQPPLLAWGVLENYRHYKDEEALRSVLPALEGYLQWDMENRDLNNNSLPEWFIEKDSPLCHSGESGLDNSPRFDSAEPLDAPDFAAFIAHDMQCVGVICHLLGEKNRAAAWREKALEVEKALHAHLWDEGDGFYYDMDFEGHLTGIKAVSGFFPMLLDGLPAGRAERMVEMLESPHFNASFPVPSTALTEPTFSNDMWRGGTWVNANYVVIEGLRRHGLYEAAHSLTEKTVSMVMKYYERCGVLFEFFDAEDNTPPPQCARKGPPDDKPYLLGKVNSIRDYHWTAALTYSLLTEERGRS